MKINKYVTAINGVTLLNKVELFQDFNVGLSEFMFLSSLKYSPKKESVVIDGFGSTIVLEPMSVALYNYIGNIFKYSNSPTMYFSARHKIQTAMNLFQRINPVAYKILFVEGLRKNVA